MEVDILIVGLGPAGATVLSTLSRMVKTEYSILAIDKRSDPGFPVQCGEYMPSPEEMERLMPSVPDTQKFFTFDKEFISTHLDKLSFISPKGKTIRTPFEGYTIHRGNWNASLVKEGIRNGAEVWTSTKAKGIKHGKVIIDCNGDDSVAVKSRVIVGADGPNSRIAKRTGMAEKRTLRNFVHVQQYSMVNITSEQFEATDAQMFFGEKYSPGAYAWIFPKNDVSANVGVGVRQPMLKKGMNATKALHNLINDHPLASKILRGAQVQHTIGGLVPVGPPLNKTVDLRTKTILVGDAASQVVSSVGAGIPPSMVAGSIAAHTITGFLNNQISLLEYHYEWQKQMLKVFKRAYKLRRFFDKISTGRDSRFQWYMDRLSPSIIDDIVHCKVPLRLTLTNPFIDLINRVIR